MSAPSRPHRAGSRPRTADRFPSLPGVSQRDGTVAVIGAALDLGQGRRGVDMGPSAIRYAGLNTRIAELGRRVLDWGNVEAAVKESVHAGDERARYLREITTT